MFSVAYSMCRKREIVACEQDIGLDTGSDTGFYLGLYTGSDIFRNIISYQEKINKHKNDYQVSMGNSSASKFLCVKNGW